MHFVHKQGVYNFSSAVSTIGNILLFVLLGVLVAPHSWFEGKFFLKGIMLFVFLSFVARPAAVFLGTIGMKIPLKERFFISWSGLRGAVPITLATYPMAYGLEGGMDIFNLVFFAVLLSLLLQGSSLGKIAKLLKLSTVSRPEAPYSLEFFTKNNMEAGQKIDVYTVDLPGPEGCKGMKIRELNLPEDVHLLMITRRQKATGLSKRAQKENDIWQVISPLGDTMLLGWDQITVLSKVEDEDRVREALAKVFEDC